MDPKVSELLEAIKARMQQVRGSPARFETGLYNLNRVQLQEALRAFVEVAPPYPMNPISKEIFWVLSARTIGMGSSYYALEYEYRSRPDAGTSWSKWFEAIDEKHRAELRQQTTKKAAGATQAERQQFVVFKQNAEDTAAGEKPAPLRDKRTTSATVKNFLQLFHQYLAGSIKQTVMSESIMSRERVLGAEELEACVLALVEAAPTYSLTNPRLLYVFEKVSSLAVRRCSGYFVLKFEWWCVGSGKKSTWSQLFAAAPGKQALKADLDLGKKRVRILDEWKFSYFHTHGKEPTFDALRRFEPAYKPELRAELSDRLHICLSNAKAVRLKSFENAWDRLVAFYEMTPPLELMLVLKWCREWVTPDDTLRDHLYWLGVGTLYAKMLRHKDKLLVYTRGFDEEEKRFLISSDRKRHPYSEDFELRLRFLVVKRNHVQFWRISKTHALLELYARKRNLELTTIADAARVYDLADTFVGKFERAKRDGGPIPTVPSIAVTQRGNLANPDATVTLGEGLGDLTVVWLEGARAYLQPRDMKGVLLIAVEAEYSHQLGQLSQDNRFYETLYENTKALLVIIPAFWQFLSYIPDLVSGGLVGLAKSVIIDLAADALATHTMGSGPRADVVAALVTVVAGHVTEPNARGLSRGSTDVVEEAVEIPLDVQRRLLVSPPDDPSRPAQRAATAADDVTPSTTIKGVDERGTSSRPVHEVEGVQTYSTINATDRGKGGMQAAAEEAAEVAADDVVRRRPRPRGHDRERRPARTTDNSGRGLPGRGTGGRETGRRGTGGQGAGSGGKVAGRSTDARRQGQPTATRTPGVLRSPAGYLVVQDPSLLDPLKQVGIHAKVIPMKSPKSGGGRFQEHGSGLNTEWHLRSPSGVEADIDAIALDTLKPRGLIAVEAKATFVVDPAKSAHMAFYPHKVEQLTRQLAVCLESKGLLRIEILVNANSVAETYLNIVAQQMARDLKKRFSRQARNFVTSTTNKAVRRLSLDDVERIVDEHVTVVVSNWGRLKASR